MAEVADTSPRGIGGWLILVVIGLVLTPFRVGYFLLTTHWPIFRDGAWPILTTPGTEAYHPLWGPLIVFEIVGNLGCIALAVIGLWLLLRKSRHAPRAVTGLLAWAALFGVIDYFAGDLIPAVAAEPDPNDLGQLARTLVSAAIWIPYFRLSRRVKATFTE